MSRQKSTDVDRSVNAVMRALEILDAFISHPGGLTRGELEFFAGLSESIILRYMLTLEAERYVFRHPDGCYELGSRAVSMSILLICTSM